jgi:hypothetical protein
MLCVLLCVLAFALLLPIVFLLLYTVFCFFQNGGTFTCKYMRKLLQELPSMASVKHYQYRIYSQKRQERAYGRTPEVLIAISALRLELSGCNPTNPSTIRDGQIFKGRDSTTFASYLQQKSIILPSACMCMRVQAYLKCGHRKCPMRVYIRLGFLEIVMGDCNDVVTGRQDQEVTTSTTLTQP